MNPNTIRISFQVPMAGYYAIILSHGTAGLLFVTEGSSQIDEYTCELGESHQNRIATIIERIQNTPTLSIDKVDEGYGDCTLTVTDENENIVFDSEDCSKPIRNNVQEILYILQDLDETFNYLLAVTI